MSAFFSSIYLPPTASVYYYCGKVKDEINLIKLLIRGFPTEAALPTRGHHNHVEHD